MPRSRLRTFKILIFLALFILINMIIEWTELRPRSLTAAVDSISLVTGLGSQVIDTLFIGVAAYVCLQIILVLSDSLRFLTGEPRREVRMPDDLSHEHGSADE